MAVAAAVAVAVARGAFACVAEVRCAARKAAASGMRWRGGIGGGIGGGGRRMAWRRRGANMAAGPGDRCKAPRGHGRKTGREVVVVVLVLVLVSVLVVVEVVVLSTTPHHTTPPAHIPHHHHQVWAVYSDSLGRGFFRGLSILIGAWPLARPPTFYESFDEVGGHCSGRCRLRRGTSRAAPRAFWRGAIGPCLVRRATSSAS